MQPPGWFRYPLKDNAVFESVEKQPIDEDIHSRVKQDEIITITVKDGGGQNKLKLRNIRFYDRIFKRELEFLTNLFEMRVDLVAAIYKLRWHIELVF
ncbi:hypothetical protein [Lentimicrobium saccharophilum]|uniref:hypothetical protein n=1 Tax=Lentimicrobium saccharophilum TaxID=1678841 RepID=UPI00191BEDD3|nr:hypothetical protein [Lentimicrobium saccharophilum]